MKMPPGARDRLASFFNSHLSVTMVALHISPSFIKDSARGLDELSFNGDAYATGQFMLKGSSANGGNIGLGEPRLIQYVESANDCGEELHFGLSLGTVADTLLGVWMREHPNWSVHDLSFIEDLTDEEILRLMGEDEHGTYPYVGPSGRMASLWSSSLSTISVLMLEELTTNSSEDVFIPAHRPSDLIDLASKFRVRENIGKDISLSDLGFELSDPYADMPLSELFVISSDTVRGSDLVRGLTIIVQTGAEKLVNQFLSPSSEFDSVYKLQHSGHVAESTAIEMVSEPSMDGSTSSCTVDGRFVVLNTDSLSVHHDFFFGHDTGSMIPALVPVLCSASESDDSLARLKKEILGDHTTVFDYSKQVELIRSIRQHQAKAHIVQASIHREEARNWSNSGQLASSIYAILGPHRLVVDDAVANAVEIVENTHQLEVQRTNIAREDALDKLTFAGAALTIFGAIITLLALFAALAAVTTGPWTWLSQGAPWVTFGVTLLGGVIAVITRKLYQANRR